MHYPIVKTRTEDHLLLYGMLLKPPAKTKMLLIAIHGTASNFYENDFMEAIAKKLDQKKISLLLTNNRGAGVMHARPISGSSVEKFEDCIKDVDAWISFAVKNNYKKIVLLGHSLGTEKVVYYLNKGKHKDNVNAVILLAPSDSFGWEEEYAKGKKLLQEAKSLVNQGKGHTFLTSEWLSYSGVMPKSASSYLDFMQENSELSKALPFHTHTLPFYRNIKIPILIIIGDQKEYTLLPIKDALELMRKENSLTEAHQFKDCNHDFDGKEEELADIVATFAEKIR